MPDIYKLKQQWLEKIMASKLPHAQKTFAFAVFAHMFGNKTVSHPDTEDLKAAGGFSSHGHFTEYRESLVACGALTAIKERRGKYKQENYTYTLNLNWDGAVAPRETRLTESHVTSGDSRGTSGDKAVAPVETSRGTSGASNTTSNTTIEYINKDNNSAQSARQDQDNFIKENDDSPYPSLEDSSAATPRGEVVQIFSNDNLSISLVEEAACSTPNNRQWAPALRFDLIKEWERSWRDHYDRDRYDKARDYILDPTWQSKEKNTMTRVMLALEEVGLEEPW